GRIGANMGRRLLPDRHQIVVFHQNPAAGEGLHQEAPAQVRAVESLQALAGALKTPRAIWLMVPSGDPVDQTLHTLMEYCAPGDIFVDGGNSNYKESVRRGAYLKERGFQFLDAGTSGGIWGLQVGYCLMVGGDADAFARLEPVVKTLAPPDGYLHTGPVGAGHFAKM